jgi:hypothetical protein
LGKFVKLITLNNNFFKEKGTKWQPQLSYLGERKELGIFDQGKKSFGIPTKLLSGATSTKKKRLSGSPIQVLQGATSSKKKGIFPKEKGTL